MARKDEILCNFLAHPLIAEKYSDDGKLPTTVREALNSSLPIVKAIALIVENLEASTPVTDSTLRNTITQYLNSAAL